MVRCLLVLAVAGCNQIYGLEDTRLPPDGPQFPVTGQLAHRWVENTAAGEPVVQHAPLTATNVVYLSVRTQDGLDDVDIADDGTFTFDRAAEDAPYRLEMVIDGEIVELHHDTPQIRYVMRSAGRFDAPSIDESFTVQFPQTTGTTRGALASTGLWSYSEASAFTGTYGFDWRSPTRTADRYGLLDASRGDALYTIDYKNGTSVDGKSHTFVAGAKRHAITMNGVDDVILSATAPVTAQPCSRLVGGIVAEITRLRDALPSVYSYVYDGWEISAAASLDIGLTGHVLLARAGFLGGDIAVRPNVHNPIASSQMAVVSGAVYSRVLQHPSASIATSLDAAFAHTVALDCGAPETIAVPTPSIGIPVDFTLDGVALDSDTAEITPTSDELTLTWNLAGGDVDTYTAYLFEVTNPATFDTTELRLARTYQAHDARLVLDLPTLVRGRYYVVQIVALRGVPGAKDGDFGEITYPLSGVQVSTSLFRIR